MLKTFDPFKPFLHVIVRVDELEAVCPGATDVSVSGQEEIALWIEAALRIFGWVPVSESMGHRQWSPWIFGEWYSSPLGISYLMLETTRS
ncbi:hypothetical protein [Castellaniella sp.]|uniref:hypothetical protein n=1 Tax=Castellaniella sp. TaxID=1955812 RepID=UPI002B003833|nr:hypothetical protein [Castellaniella sp.]